MMKKVLSALAVAAFAGAAYASKITVGAQINPGIEFTDICGEKKDSAIHYYLDGDDTRFILKYQGDDGVVGTFITQFSSTGQVVPRVVDVKFPVFGPVYMILGKQPNLIKVYDISLNDVDNLLSKVGVTVGANFNNMVNVQASLLSNKTMGDASYSHSYAYAGELGATVKTSVADVVAAFDFAPGKPGDDTDDVEQLFALANVKKLPLPVKLTLENVYYLKGKGNLKQKRYDIIADAELANPIKLLTKCVTPYVTAQASISNTPYVNDENSKLSYGHVYSIRVGTKMQLAKNLTHDGYIQYDIKRDNKRHSTDWAIVGDFTLKFAKAIDVN